MKREYLAVLVSTVLTLVVAILLIRWLAPSLLGVHTDMQMVQVGKEVPPFFDNVFREVKAEDGYSINDPVIRTRATPFYPNQLGMGPNDLLGFRNKSIPTFADVITIGDSQTYGNNAEIDQNWPAVMQQQIQSKSTTYYNMSTGGWGGIQYLEMAKHALKFKPRAMVVAYYSGNDPVDSFALAYASPRWKDYRLRPELDGDELPKAKFPAPEEEWWVVTFADGYKTRFTPKLRFAANDRSYPGILTGYEIMAQTGEAIANLTSQQGIKLVFTIIPTKELVFKKKLLADKIPMNREYEQLVENEEANIKELENRLKQLEHSNYVEMVSTLQDAALHQAGLYPSTINGHPDTPGYAVIGRRIATELQSLLPDLPRGLYARMISPNAFQLCLVSGGGYWVIASDDILEKNGWPPGSVQSIDSRTIDNLDFRGVLNTVDRERFGPAAFER